MSTGRSLKLNNDCEIPALGFGTWKAAPGETVQAVKEALEVGYRHIDGATVYGNEKEVGEGIRQSGVPRDQIFVTSKLWNTYHDPEWVEKGLDKALNDLGLEYLDLYLMHWACAFETGEQMFPVNKDGRSIIADIDYIDTWKAMEKLVQTGKVKAIGVSNFSVDQLERLLKVATIVPAVNQIEAHPWLQQPELVQFCHDKNIAMVAYSSLGNNLAGFPRCIDDDEIQTIAKSLGRTPAQLVLSWGITRGFSVLTKTVSKSRMVENFQDFIVNDATMKQLNALDKGPVKGRFNWNAKWGLDIFGILSTAQVEEAVERFLKAPIELDNRPRFD